MQCVTDAVAGWWVPVWTAMMVDKRTIETQNNEIRLSLVHQDLHASKHSLDQQEATITQQIEELSREAYRRKTKADIQGAKRVLMKRRNMGIQLNRLQNTMMLIESHINVLESAELDRSILDTLRASGDALKKLGVEIGLEKAEDIVSDVQEQVQTAQEITRVIATGSANGIFNMMGADFMDDQDLQNELDELLDEETSDSAFMGRIKTLGVPSDATLPGKNDVPVRTPGSPAYEYPTSENRMDGYAPAASAVGETQSNEPTGNDNGRDEASEAAERGDTVAAQ